MKQRNKTSGVVALAITLSIVFASVAYMASAAPQGPSISYVSNSSKDNSAGIARNDARGTIHTTNMNMVQQNTNWKAYVGNITGSLTLDDADSYTIYNWAFTTITGEVYATRASSVTWGSAACSDSDTIASEHTQMGFINSDIDSINKTYNYTNHPSFSVGTVPIANSTCRSAYTFIDDAAQGTAQTNNFTAVLLEDGSSMIYSTLVADNGNGYRTGAGDTYDFQLLIAENKSSTAQTTYYFYVELGS
jgi:hypothetical protein